MSYLNMHYICTFTFVISSRAKLIAWYEDEGGAVVEWSETLDYGAESRRKVMRSHPGVTVHPTAGKLLCQPSSKWVPCSNQGKIGQRNERDGFARNQLCPKYSGSLPYGF